MPDKTKKKNGIFQMKWEKSSSLHPHLLNLLHFGRKHRNFYTKADYFRSLFDRKNTVRYDAIK